MKTGKKDSMVRCVIRMERMLKPGITWKGIFMWALVLGILNGVGYLLITFAFGLPPILSIVGFIGGGILGAGARVMNYFVTSWMDSLYFG